MYPFNVNPLYPKMCVVITEVYTDIIYILYRQCGPHVIRIVCQLDNIPSVYASILDFKQVRTFPMS